MVSVDLTWYRKHGTAWLVLGCQDDHLYRGKALQLEKSMWETHPFWMSKESEKQDLSCNDKIPMFCFVKAGSHVSLADLELTR